MKQDLLITFCRNLAYGKVKTRLAASIGNDKAFGVYEALLKYTQEVVASMECDKVVYYSDYIETQGFFNGYDSALQQGADLGERIMHAFAEAFKNHYNKVVIIGTDCFEITPAIVRQAFEQLESNSIVIGPAHDGGYYLLGMRSLQKTLFKNITWSTNAVLKQTISACDDRGLGYSLLPILNDVDNEQDLKNIPSGGLVF